MGLPAPLDMAEDELRFTVEDVDIRLALQPDGLGLVMVALLGHLATDSFTAESQLRGVLRLSLGLAAFNRGCLCVPGLFGAPERIAALHSGAGVPEAVEVRLAFADAPGQASAALQEVVQWASYAREVLPVGSGAASLEARQRVIPEPDVMIFQP